MPCSTAISTGSSRRTSSGSSPPEAPRAALAAIAPPNAAEPARSRRPLLPRLHLDQLDPGAGVLVGLEHVADSHGVELVLVEVRLERGRLAGVQAVHEVAEGNAHGVAQPDHLGEVLGV